MKTRFLLSASILLASVVLFACSSTESVSPDAVETAIAQTQQVEDAIQQGIAATQTALAPVATVESDAAPDTVEDQAPSDEPTPADDTEPAVEPEKPTVETNVEFEGINFNLNYDIFSSWSVEITDPPDPTSDNPFQDPSYYKFEFRSDVIDTERVPDAKFPRLFVIPVANLESFLGKGYGLFQLAQLQDLLANRPDTVDGSMPSLPYLLTANNSEVLHTNLEYLDFQNGSGVRFLATHAQAVFPVAGLAYYFQGLSSDGAYYISFVVPVRESALTEYNAPYADGFEDEDAYYEFAENFAAYLLGAEALLNAASSESFTPDLVLLDAIVQSILISR